MSEFGIKRGKEPLDMRLAAPAFQHFNSTHKSYKKLSNDCRYPSPPLVFN